MRAKPKKRLGQNFLVDKNIQRKIIGCLGLGPSDVVLEIGAGRGELTGLLATEVEKVYALEIDPHLCAVLNEGLKGQPNIEVINQDILKFDFKKYLGGVKKKVKVVGNIPYYISSPIVEYLVGARDNIDSVFITVQKEFAQRMAAAAGSKLYGSFSCFTRYYFTPKIVLNIKKTCFFPVPKVDSCLVRLEPRPKHTVKPENEKLFFKIIRAAFNYRRKTLRNSLTGIIPAPKLEAFFDLYGIDVNIRPEKLSLEDFANLSNA
ncbi:MAG: 16S rRNA (adenine(1518)-N(6)/adenine(1519)-N(6))-dimethyltransferase RsmA [Candidatus Omnitrophota bacterium]